MHAAMDVLGLATTADGTIGARFSDTLKLDFDDQRQVDGLKLKPLHYENQFDIASGAYTLKIVFSAGGDSFGKLELPLVVPPAVVVYHVPAAAAPQLDDLRRAERLAEELVQKLDPGGDDVPR